MNVWEEAIMKLRQAEEAERHKALNYAEIKGYFKCLEDFGIWSNGVQRIGCFNRDIKDIKKEVLENGGIE